MVSNEFSFEPDLNVKDRRSLAAYLDETARRAVGGGNDPDDLAAAFVRILGTRLDDPGPVSIRIGQLDEAKRLVVRRLIYSARERAAGGEASRAVAGAMLAILGAWETTIRYDPKAWFEGPRNPWAEPVTGTGSRGLGGVWAPA